MPSENPQTSPKMQQAIRLHQAGKFSEAECIYRQMINDGPVDANVHHLLGVAAAQQGRYRESIDAISQAIADNPGEATYHANLGNSYLELEQFEDALDAYDNALKLNPNGPAVHFAKGNTLQLLERLEEALVEYRLAMDQRPKYTDALSNLGAILLKQGEMPEAIEAFRKSLEWEPDNFAALGNLGNALRISGAWDESTECFTQLVARRPNFAAGWKGLGRVEVRRGRVAEAIEFFKKAIALTENSDDIFDLYSRVIPLLYRVGAFDDVREMFADLETKISDPEQIAGLKAIEMDNLLSKEEARRLESHLTKEKQSESTSIPAACFALARHLDGEGEFEKAFEFYSRGNAANHDASKIDNDALDSISKSICARFTPEVVNKLMAHGSRSRRPLFIFGMMRSGTTLTEQIVATHPDVAGGGELTDMASISRAAGQLLLGGHDESLGPIGMTADAIGSLSQRYLARLEEISADSRYVTDKLPGNFQNLGLLAILFPEATYIHCRRDARDTCLSNYFQNFAHAFPFANDLYCIGRQFRRYEAMMDHWRQSLPISILELDYEETVSDLEDVSRRVLEHCNLDWEPGVLDFHKTDRTISTGSLWQARQPIYQSSSGRWKNYAKYIEPLERGLRGDPAN